MACFEVILSFKNAIINIANSYKSMINVFTKTAEINVTSSFTEPTVGAYYDPVVISTSKEEIDIKVINISVVCDINYGIPLYAPDGSICTIDGKAVYVRSAKTYDYE